MTRRQGPHGRNRRPVVLLALTLLGLAGCWSPDTPAGGAAVVTDSAGISVVQVARPTGEEAAWRVGARMVVGGPGSPSAPDFGYVAALDVDAAGRIHVLDQQARVVHLFAPGGEHLGTVGGPGEGPGELGPFPGSLLVRGDTVLVADWSRDRLTRLATADGSLLSTEPLPGEGGARTWWKATGTGIHYRSLARFTDEDGRWAGRDALLRYTGRGAADTLLVLDYQESDVGAPGAPRAPLLVGAPSWTVLADGRIAWIAPGEARVRVHETDGRLSALVSLDAWRPRVPSPAEVETLEEKLGDRLEMLGGSREALARIPVVAPDVLPAITRVEAGPGGTVWVQRMGPVEDVHPMALNTPDPPVGLGGPVWDVLDPAEGWRWVGTVELPPRFRLMRVTDEAVHGVVSDELDVDRVVRFGLRPGQGASPPQPQAREP